MENAKKVQNWKRSMMLYMFPFLDRLVVEFRYDGSGPLISNSWQWRLRNWVWKTVGPFVGMTASLFIPFKRIRYWLIDQFNRIAQLILTRVLRGCHTSPAD